MQSVDFINVEKSVSLGEIEDSNKGIITAKYSGICEGSGSAVINSGIKYFFINKKKTNLIILKKKEN